MTARRAEWRGRQTAGCSCFAAGPSTARRGAATKFHRGGIVKSATQKSARPGSNRPRAVSIVGPSHTGNVEILLADCSPGDVYRDMRRVLTGRTASAYRQSDAAGELCAVSFVAGFVAAAIAIGSVIVMTKAGW